MEGTTDSFEPNAGKENIGEESRHSKLEANETRLITSEFCKARLLGKGPVTFYRMNSDIEYLKTTRLAGKL